MKALARVLPLLLALAACAGVPESQPTAKKSRVAKVVSREAVDERTDKLVIDSPATDAEQAVWVIKPTAYTEGSSGWRALYLLHGCCSGGAWDWVSSGEVAKLTAGLNAVVIVPEGGPMGWYADWKRGPAWETFHTSELPRLVEPRYGVSGPRSVAGYSMGGHGAFGYAARHPGMFEAAAAFSGVLDIRENVPGYQSFFRRFGLNATDAWGDPATWPDHNPADQVARLKGVRLYLACGDGKPGALDPEGTSQDLDETEAGILRQNANFLAAAKKAGVPVTTDLYGHGTHTWPYWIRSLEHALPLLLP